MSLKRRFKRCSLCGFRDPYMCKLKERDKSTRISTRYLAKHEGDSVFNTEAVCWLPACKRYRTSVISMILREALESMYTLFKGEGEDVIGEMTIEMYGYTIPLPFIPFKWTMKYEPGKEEWENDVVNFVKYIEDIIYVFDQEFINQRRFVTYHIKKITFLYCVD